MNLYPFARVLAAPFFTFLFRPIFIGKEHVPKEGGCILVGNHISYWDFGPPALVTKRQVHYMGKQELFRNKFVRWLLQSVGAFSVDRGKADLGAVRAALALVQSGKVLGMFPEGTRNPHGELGKLEGGVAMIALRGNVPVIPIHIQGPYRFFHRLVVVAGAPVDLSSAYDKRLDAALISETMEKITDALRGARKTAEKTIEIWPNRGKK